MTPETEKRGEAGTLSQEKEECFHCNQVRRLVLPEKMLCMMCDSRKKWQDRQEGK